MIITKEIQKKVPLCKGTAVDMKVRFLYIRMPLFNTLAMIKDVQNRQRLLKHDWVNVGIAFFRVTLHMFPLNRCPTYPLCCFFFCRNGCRHHQNSYVLTMPQTYDNFNWALANRPIFCSSVF